jgi:hypothetical protein
MPLETGPDFIGRINVPEIAPSGTFPLVTDYPNVLRIQQQVAVHRFISANGKIEQRFKLGSPLRRWRASWQSLTDSDLQSLRDFWNARTGAYEPFTLNAPSDDGTTTTAYTVRFENEPLNYSHLRQQCTGAGVNMVEVPSGAPLMYEVVAELDRFPTAAMESGLDYEPGPEPTPVPSLLDQEQELIPLIEIRPLVPGEETYADYPTIYLSDRRVYMGSGTSTDGQLYQARLLSWSGISQKLGGQSDNATLTFGNADRVMRDLAADVDLFRARVKFSLYHVNTGNLVHIWQGDIIDYESTADDQFTVTAVDGLYDITLQYPTRRVSPTCWKTFDDGRFCPWSSQGSNDLVRFPLTSEEGDGKPTEAERLGACDKKLLTPNGCKAHGMKRWFGGITATPQSVRIKDNSTGHFGTGRTTVTATSLVSDSMMGQPLIEIYTSVPTPIKGIMVAGRDESDFYEGHAIVGEGPITRYASGDFDSEGNKLFHKLDGQPAHTYPSSYGREIRGTDPAGASDFFSLDQGGNVVNGDPDKVFEGASTYLDQFAAGTAAVIVRRVDEKGIQLTTLEEHTLEVWVAEGLPGWVWSEAGVRELVAPLTNPVWIAVNVFLRGIGLRIPLDDSNPTETNLEELLDLAETKFDIPAAVAAAYICDLEAPKIIGTGTETQFPFQGVLRDIKVLKDWLQEILNTCLGLFYFSNGKLKITIREDAAAAHSFSGGNMIYNSLRLRPKRAAFNRLTVSFANLDYNFVADTLPVQDDDSIARLGRVYDSTMNLVGAAGKSQVARIAATRLKEEGGGVGYEEQKRARLAEWKSTVLALGVEPSTGVSIDDDDVPNGTGLFRVTGWILNPDFSIDFLGETITDTMYDLVVGPKATDVPANGVPAEFFPSPLRSAWDPYEEQPAVDDPVLMRQDWSFGLAQEYETRADGSKRLVLVVTGKQPVNKFLPNVAPPIIKSQTEANTGGLLQGGRNYWVQVAAYVDFADGTRRWSPASNIRTFKFDDVSSDFNQLTVGSIEWPAIPAGGEFSEFSGCALFAGDAEQVICWQFDDAGASLPTSLTLATALFESTFNAPNPNHKFIRAKAKFHIHAGAIGEQITAINSGAGTIEIGGLAGGGDDWTGRVLSVFADQSDGRAPLWNYLITAWNDATATATLDPTPDGLEVGDVVTIRYIPEIFEDYRIGDSKVQNAQYPAGATPGAEIGHLIRAFKSGFPTQVRRVVDNDETSWTIDEPFDFEPDYFIVEESDWSEFADSSPISVTASNVSCEIRLSAQNLRNKSAVVGCFLVDRRGNETAEQYAPIREIYCFGEESIGTFEYATFNLATSIDLATGTDVAPHWRAKNYSNPELGQLEFKVPPQGQSIIIDVILTKDDGTYSGSIFTGGEKLEIPANSTDVVFQDLVDSTLEIAPNDLITVNVEQVGTDAAGRVGTLIVHCRVAAPPDNA